EGETAVGDLGLQVLELLGLGAELVLPLLLELLQVRDRLLARHRGEQDLLRVDDGDLEGAAGGGGRRLGRERSRQRKAEQAGRGGAGKMGSERHHGFSLRSIRNWSQY